MEKEKMFTKEIADIKTDFAQWYTDVVLKTEMADYGPVKGTMVIRPYGYAVWENIQKALDSKFKETGHVNAYFPLLIPMKFFEKEAEHVEGFAPELVTVTQVGEEVLGEKLVVRPTSETIFGNMYSKWIQSWRDLPVLINQWANVMRWEKTTRPFLRTSEFLWQEGHTAHATEQEAEEETLKMLNVYKDFARDYLAIPMFAGVKSEREKFAGAVRTYGIEAMMQDGKSLQAGTSHYLGQNFSKAFDIKFLDKDGTHKYVYTTSWGTTTRLIGALIMVHGDNRGLRIPPFIAPIQVIIVPITMQKEGVLDNAYAIKERLEKIGIKVKVDSSEQSPGWKFNEWEMKGVPVRLEIGPRDIENNVVQVFRRDNFEKETVSNKELEKYIPELLQSIHNNMYKQADDFRKQHIKEVKNIEELKEAVDAGNFAKGHFCGCVECEEHIKELTTATTRVSPFDEKESEGVCVGCGKKANKVMLFGKQY